jgi:hypothetical protein
MNMNVIEKIPNKVTPLWIVAAFVTLTEAVLGYAVTKVTGGVQIALTSFVILFGLGVAGAFFAILWNRPYVFYPPSEYGSADPSIFIGAFRSAIPARVAQQIELVSEIERFPANQEAQFRLTNSLVDDAYQQLFILMHEKSVKLPFGEVYPGFEYELERTDSAVEGNFNVHRFVKEFEGTRFISIEVTAGPSIVLTEFGHKYAAWLIKSGRRADYFRTSLGEWGSIRPGGFLDHERERMKSKTLAETVSSRTEAAAPASAISGFQASPSPASGV